jgi:hypothetical protein
MFRNAITLQTRKGGMAPVNEKRASFRMAKKTEDNGDIIQRTLRRRFEHRKYCDCTCISILFTFCQIYGKK